MPSFGRGLRISQRDPILRRVHNPKPYPNINLQKWLHIRCLHAPRAFEVKSWRRVSICNIQKQWDCQDFTWRRLRSQVLNRWFRDCHKQRFWHSQGSIIHAKDTNFESRLEAEAIPDFKERQLHIFGQAYEVVCWRQPWQVLLDFRLEDPPFAVGHAWLREVRLSLPDPNLLADGFFALNHLFFKISFYLRVTL